MDFLKQTLSSLCKQSMQQFEIIIVNDASSLDQYKNLISTLNYQPKDNNQRLKIITNKINKGPGESRNIGVQSSKSQFIFFLDSDDLLEPTTLDKLYWHLLSNPEVYFTKGYTVGFSHQQYIWKLGFHSSKQFLTENAATVSAMIRKSVFNKVSFQSHLTSGLEDWDFWLNCAKHHMWGTTVHEITDWYRRHPANQYLTKWKDWEVDIVNHYKELSSSHDAFTNPKHISNNCMFQNKQFDPSMVDQQLIDKYEMNILIIIPWFTMGGADHFNLNLLQQLIKRGWKVTIVATLQKSDWLIEFQKYTPDIYILPNFINVAESGVDFLCYLMTMRNFKVVMISNSEFGYHVLPILVHLHPNVLYIDYVHMEEENWNHGGYAHYSIMNTNRLDAHIVASQHLKDWMVSRGGIEDGTIVCRVNVDSNLYKRDWNARSEMRSKLGIHDDTVVVLYAARLVSQKQPMVMINVLKQLKDRFNHANTDATPFAFIIAGDGDDKRKVVMYMHSNQLWTPHVHFVGAINKVDMLKYMSASDLLFLPSQMEGIALVIYEAMSMELCVVGANVGGQLELVTRDTGILLDVDGKDQSQQVEMYTNEIASLIVDKRFVAMGMASRQRIVDHFDIEDMGQCVIHDVLESIKKRDAAIQPIALKQVEQIVEDNLGVMCLE
ncbi:hypothetical protein AKO1_010706 [Acrasis kona]|uniref:Glycosyltransferase n=1 Tax=Acrasis kona TaxID=1008807 RepID=A0AAW2ZJ62_9EUKA